MASVVVVLVILSLVQGSWEQTDSWSCPSSDSCAADVPIPAEETNYALSFSRREYGNSTDEMIDGE